LDLKKAGHSRVTGGPLIARQTGGILAALAISVCVLLLAPAIASAAEPESIKGTVTDASTTKPIEKAAACPYNVERKELEEEKCAFTNSHGEYTISGLAAGEYKVAFIANFDGLNYITQLYKDASTLALATELTVTETGPAHTEIDAAMQEGAEITGEVTDASTSDALEGVEVCALETEKSEGELVSVGCTETSSSGRYTLAGLPSGKYKVEFFDGGVTYLTQYYEDKSTFEAAMPVEVTAPGGRKTGIDAALMPTSTLVPESTGAPQVSGTPEPGDTLFCSTGVWSNSPIAYAYKWLRNGVAAAGQTSSTYPVQSTDVGEAISCQVTALNEYGSRTATSNIVVVSAPPSPAPKSKPLKCKKGFKKKKVHGKDKCVKVKKHTKKHV
jgi:hypothetical protein